MTLILFKGSPNQKHKKMKYFKSEEDAHQYFMKSAERALKKGKNKKQKPVPSPDFNSKSVDCMLQTIASINH